MAIPMDFNSRRRQDLPLSSPCLKPGASRSFFGENAAQNVTDLLAKTLQFPTQAYVIILNHSSSGNLQKKMSLVEGSLILKC